MFDNVNINIRHRIPKARMWYILRDTHTITTKTYQPHPTRNTRQTLFYKFYCIPKHVKLFRSLKYF